MRSQIADIILLFKFWVPSSSGLGWKLWKRNRMWGKCGDCKLADTEEHRWESGNWSGPNRSLFVHGEMDRWSGPCPSPGNHCAGWKTSLSTTFAATPCLGSCHSAVRYQTVSSLGSCHVLISQSIFFGLTVKHPGYSVSGDHRIAHENFVLMCCYHVCAGDRA